jgi:UDP-N-acetylmuramoyl-L-alanyl-D-glutamate--2,6-diaminopimelate ligase
MKLKNILLRLPLERKLREFEISGISSDSRLAKNSDLFFIKERKNFDTFSILKNVDKKIKVFVAEDKVKNKIKPLLLKKPIIFVKDINPIFYMAADRFYGFSNNDFIFIGVTGTKGKTTTIYLIHHILKSFNQECALIGTIEYIVGSKTYATENTTPDYLALRKIFREAKRNRTKFIVMEVSSHGIKQQRIAGIKFAKCVFTNLKREHLDYHKTMRDYFNVKKSFFTVNKEAQAIINLDDPYGRKIRKEVKNVLTYAILSKADLRATDICLNKKGLSFILHYGGNTVKVKAPLLGRHNVYNILAAIAVLLSLKFSLTKIVKCISYFKSVEGRLEEIMPDIFVDYAHTPDSLKKAILALKDIGYKKVICVFGCGGNRDRGKRKIMGKVSADLADFSIITADNPRNEDVYSICAQIENGFKKKNYSVIIDRRQAIRKALMLKCDYKGCGVLVAGKGHEDYQVIGDKKFPFSDSSVIRELTNADNRL